MMPLHAFTDGLVALAGIFAFLTLIKYRRNNTAVFAAYGLGFMGLAAIVGTIKFLGGWQELLDPWHSAASRLGGISGMTLLALAFWGLASPGFVQRLPQMATVLITMAMYFGSAAAEIDAAVAKPIGAFAMLVALISGIQLIRGHLRLAGLRAILIAIVMLANGLGVYAIFPDPWNFHIFHVILAGLVFAMMWHFRPITIR